jgi:ABC-type lipoprotein export system ATPase subunit
MREKSYKNRVIQCLKEENAKLRQTVQVMTHNTAWATA